jgi:hypothetical protein
MPVIHQSTNSIQTSADTDGVDLVTDNETLIIDPGVLVLSEIAMGVYNHNRQSFLEEPYVNPTLINKGFIEADSVFPAVSFDEPNAFIFNAPGATIYAPNAAAIELTTIDTSETDGAHRVVNNHGAIVGADGIIFEPFSTLPLKGVLIVNNYGDINATSDGVINDSNSAGATIRNYNTLIGGDAAVDVQTAPGLETVVYNAAGALIEGKVGVISGRIHFENHGAVLGDVNVQDAEKAVIINPGQILGDVHLGLGGGDDYFDGAGGTSGAIYGGGGDDRIIAGKGSVDVHVGGGSDLITGGPGSDHFIFDSPLAGQIETITNFHPRGVHPLRGGKMDKIVLSETDFSGIVPGPNGHTLSPGEFFVDIAPKNGLTKIVYDSGNGFLYFSPVNESGLPQQHIHFATISPHLALTAADFLVVA